MNSLYCQNNYLKLLNLLMFLNNRKKNRSAVFIILGLVLVGGCKYDKEELLSPAPNPSNTCATIPATFNANVLPLVTTKCAIPGCHNAAASGGRIFQNYNQVNLAKDRINTRVVVEKSMPPFGPLSPSEINTLKCWIEAGGLNN